MNKAWTRTCLMGLALTIVTLSVATAQSGGMIVAVIDTKKVFDNYTSFQGNLRRIRDEMTAYKQQSVTRRKALGERVKQLRELKPSSVEYKQLEAEIAQAESSLVTEAKLKQNEILRREAKEHYAAYQQVLAAIARVAQKHNISLVLRYDSADIDPSNVNSVVRGLNRTVVYQNRLDITDLVTHELNQVARAPATPRR